MEKKTIEGYKKEVLKKYEREKNGEMGMFFIEPTRKKIREACIWALEIRNEKNDPQILNRFFNFKEQKEILKTIENFDADKFRPIVNFLIGETSNTSDKNLELIAWLVDFKPRPRSEYLKPQNSFPFPKKQNIAQPIGSPKPNKNNPIVKNQASKKIIPTISITVMCALISGFYFNYNNNRQAASTHVNQCMTWADTSYVKVSCDMGSLSKYGTPIKPLNPAEFKTMKKVNVSMSFDFFSETTNKPLVWYYKNKNGEVEFFTAPGLHPVNGETLKKITQTIIENYVPLHSNNLNSFVP